MRTLTYSLAVVTALALAPFTTSTAEAQIGPARQIQGSPVAAEAVHARFVWGGTGNRILWVNQADEVFFNRVVGNRVQMHIRLRGHTVGHAGDPTEYVIPWGTNRILVVTRRGNVYTHTIRGESVGPPEQISGAPVGTQGQDPVYMFRIRGRLVNVTRQGEIWVHRIGNVVSPPTRVGQVALAAPRQVRHAFNIGPTVYIIFSDGGIVSHHIHPNWGRARMVRTGNNTLGQAGMRFVWVMGNRLYATNQAGLLWAHDISRLLNDHHGATPATPTPAPAQ